jgi:uncharacterized membrane protein YdbT with pleckstrin-like domain
MKIETLAANIKAAVLWWERNSAAVRTLFMSAAAIRPVHSTNLTSRYPVFYGGHDSQITVAWKDSERSMKENIDLVVIGVAIVIIIFVTLVAYGVIKLG